MKSLFIILMSLCLISNVFAYTEISATEESKIIYPIGISVMTLSAFKDSPKMFYVGLSIVGISFVTLGNPFWIAGGIIMITISINEYIKEAK